MVRSLAARAACFCFVLLAAGGLKPAAALEPIWGPPGPLAIAPWAPGITVWSPDAEVRERQAISRQLAVLDYVRWHSRALAYDAWWTPPYYDPLFIWGFPITDAVAQPVGHRRIYDGRGGYSYEPVYAEPLPHVKPPVHAEGVPHVQPPPPEAPEEGLPIVERPLPRGRRGFAW